MAIIYSQLGEPLTSEIIGALIDLTALARKASWAASEHVESVANDMLTCVLTLCRAERGAVLLREDHARFEQCEHPSPAAARERGFRVLALHHLREEEAYTLLTPLSTSGVSVQSPDRTCWMAYRLSLDEQSADEAHHRLEMLPNASSNLADQAQLALLVIGWMDQSDQEHAHAALIAHCSELLLLVTDAIETVISSILLKERVDVLEREATREALEGMELLKGELLGTVSHELRGPLASIKGYAATLLRHDHRLAREERHQFLLAVNEASDRLEVIIERLLDLSQVETDQAALKRSPIDIARLANEAIAVMEERVTTSRSGHFIFSLQLENADGTPGRSVPLILADPRRLREMLDQLLENAIKFSPGGGLITVTLRPVVQVSAGAQAGEALHRRQERGSDQASGACDMLEMCITDTGKGIPVEHLERIFEGFHRVDTRLTRETGGLGLGLTICKRIVELHGGAIWAENRSSGKGSAFYVRLPIDETAALS